MSERREIRLEVDYGQRWPLSDIMWPPSERPNWGELLSEGLIEELAAWAAFFNAEADWETGLFGSEEKRRWFDLEGFRLREALVEEIGELFEVRLRLWF